MGRKKLSRRSMFVIACVFGILIILQSAFIIQEGMCLFYRMRIAENEGRYEPILERIDNFMIMWKKYRLGIVWVSGAITAGSALLLVGWIFVDWKDADDYAKKMGEEE